MKALVLFFLVLILPVLARAESTCVSAKPNRNYTEHFLYVGQNHWWLEVDGRLLEVKDDKVVSSIVYPGNLKIMCGTNGRVIAISQDKIMELVNGKLVPLPIPFKGSLTASDGEVAYSLDFGQNLNALYSNKDGIFKKIGEQSSVSGTLSGDFYIWTNHDLNRIFVLKHGNVIAKYPIPAAASSPRVFDYGLCKGNGLFSAQHTFMIKSRFGIQSKTIDDLIANVDYATGCEEYLFLLNDVTYTKGQLWSLKPGKKLSFTPISTSCPVDHFASNADGSLYYRCGNQFYYKDKARTKDLLLGSATKLQLTPGASDRWLETKMDGTLYSFPQYPKTNQPRTACFVRLMPDRLVDIGCF